MYEMDLGHARLTAMRNSVPEDLARFVHSEYKERDADWLFVKRDGRH